MVWPTYARAAAVTGATAPPPIRRPASWVTAGLSMKISVAVWVCTTVTPTDTPPAYHRVPTGPQDPAARMPRPDRLKPSWQRNPDALVSTSPPAIEVAARAGAAGSSTDSAARMATTTRRNRTIRASEAVTGHHRTDRRVSRTSPRRVP